MNIRNPLRLLSDAPAVNDAFAGDGHVGPHASLAALISEIIQSDDAHVRTIGLEGRWGSGKSTVIAILHQLLSRSKETLAFTFDAWSHEGDPLRRTFLEMLIQELTAATWIDGRDWETERLRLCRRLKDSTRTIRSTPTWFGIFLAISLVLVPFGHVIVRDCLRTGHTFFPSGESTAFSLMMTLGTFMALLPLFVASANLLRICWKSLSILDAANWAFLARNDTVVEQVASSETGDPTSVEFEDVFSKLVGEALSIAGRRLIITIDNLDRVEPETAIAIWSTLQTFASPRITHNWLRRVLVIVPYDPDGLRKIWEKDDAEQKLLESFLSKSFSVRLRVPPQTLTHWRQFLADLLSQSLPEAENGAIRSIVSAYDVLRRDQETSPTPRRLKAFVNSLAILRAQTNGAFDLRHLVYFIERCRHLGVAKDILSGNLPTAEDLATFGDNLRESVASIYFGVRPGEVYEILLHDPLLARMRSGDATGLIELSERHPRGFWDVLEKAIAVSLTDSGLVERANAIFAVDALARRNRQAIGASADLLCRAYVAALREVHADHPAAHRVFDGVKAAIHLCQSPSLARDCYDAGERLLQGQVSSVNSSDKVRIAIEIARCAASNIANSGEILPLRFFCEPVHWSEVCEILDVNKGLVRPTLSIGELDQFFASNLEGAGSKDCDCLELTTNYYGGGFEWPVLNEAIETRLRATEDIPRDKSLQILFCFARLLRMQNAHAQRTLENLVSQGALHHHLHAQRKVPDSRFLLAAMILSVDPSGEPPATKPGNWEGGYNNLKSLLAESNTAKRLCDELVRLGKPRTLDSIWRRRGLVDPIVIEAVCAVLTDRKWSEYLDPATIAERLRELRNTVQQRGQNPADVLAAPLADQMLVDRLLQKFSIGEADLYSDLFGKSADGARIPVWLIAKIEAATPGDWEQVDSGHPIVNLVTGAVTGDRPISLGTNCLPLIERWATDAINGQAISDDEIKRRVDFIGTVRTPGARVELRRFVLEMACRMNGIIAAPFWALFGNVVSDGEAIQLVQSILSRLFCPLIRARNWNGIKWMHQLLSTRDGLFARISKDDNLPLWSEELKAVNLLDLDPEVRALVVSLCELTEVELPH